LRPVGRFRIGAKTFAQGILTREQALGESFVYDGDTRGISGIVRRRERLQLVKVSLSIVRQMISRNMN
jgi:hypothetical protein